MNKDKESIEAKLLLQESLEELKGDYKVPIIIAICAALIMIIFF